MRSVKWEVGGGTQSSARFHQRSSWHKGLQESRGRQNNRVSGGTWDWEQENLGFPFCLNHSLTASISETLGFFIQKIWIMMWTNLPYKAVGI